ncbi:inactive serine/threonine-protein kinase TEX14 isoform X2 [Engystomops pustulosus]|uniref:inactive serine/threonine-protein kinase TEX14 isoform X2 n=1 Tax=Engystomops pustulosus TaxID=76066 RepID=UPI003AFAF714
MSLSKTTLPPYPVEIGSVKHCSPDKHLQEYVQCGNFAKVKKMLKRGILPDSTNSQGQTALFVAALLGLRKIVELLLNFGSNPNHRCNDWSTPVHAAAFSCDLWIMSSLIRVGGDLRLHDKKSKQPYDWALMAGKDQSAQMIEFIDRCTVRMQALIHFYPLKHMKIGASCDLNERPSIIDLLSPRSANRYISKPMKSENRSLKKACNFGYGQFCIRDNGQAGFLLTFPFIEIKSLVREESKPTFCYAAGPFMTMTHFLWGSTEVTCKGLSDTAHHECYADLLIAEEEKMSYLQHPLILQLLALSTSPSLERKHLVFERVTYGSFYNILHERRSEFPILHLETIVHIFLQMIEALEFIHWRGFIHRSFSSHAIQIVSADRAKLSHFEYMVESNENKNCEGNTLFPIPKQLFYWSSPEIVAGKIGTIKSDLYSFCAVMQEGLTDSLPWNELDGEAVMDAMVSGHYLTVDPNLSEPYYSIVCTGIHARPKERTTSLQDIGYILKNDIKHSLDKVPYKKHDPFIVEADGHMKVQYTARETPQSTFKEITDPFYKATNIPSYNASMAVSYVDSQTETLCDFVDDADEMNADLSSLQKRDRNRAEDQQNAESSSISLSLISNSETSTSSDAEEEDIDCHSLEIGGDWQAELQTLDNSFNLIQIHNKSTVDNLLYIQTTLRGEKAVLNAKEDQKESQDACKEQNIFPHNGRDETDHVLPQKSYGGWYAKGPPHRYIPPRGASYDRTDIASDTRQIQSKTVLETAIKASKNRDWCPDLGSCQQKTLEKVSSSQDFMQITKRRPTNSQADDDDIMRHKYYQSPDAAPQRPKIQLAKGTLLSCPLKSSSQRAENGKLYEYYCGDDTKELKGDKDWSEDREETKLEKLFHTFAGKKYQYQEGENYCDNPVGMKPVQIEKDTSKDTDDSTHSTETSYFTPEIDISMEKMDKEAVNVCDETDHTFEEWSPGPSSSMCFDKTLLTWAGKRVLENKMPDHTTTTTNNRSTIDVEELSSISSHQKSSLLNFTTPRNTEASARHSTPLSPGKLISATTSKRKPYLEKQLSPNGPNERSLASLSSNKSKTSEHYLSAMCDSATYSSPHQKQTSSMNDQTAVITPIKNRKSGSDDYTLPAPQCSPNKTEHF